MDEITPFKKNVNEVTNKVNDLSVNLGGDGSNKKIVDNFNKILELNDILKPVKEI